MPEIDLPGGPEFPFVVHVGDVEVTWHRLPLKGDAWMYVATVDDRVWIVNDSYDVREGYAGDVRLALAAWSPSAVEWRNHAKRLAEAIEANAHLP